MNDYRMYLIDYDGTSIELDTEDLDFGLDFKIASLTDLSYRSGNRTKEVTLKGTKTNLQAFGYIHRLGRTNDLQFDNKLFFNYNSLRQVDCLIYHDTNLVFRGTLRLTDVVQTKEVFYFHCVITDAVIDFVKYTQDKLLTDLDFNDLTHEYSISSITQSWSQQTQRRGATGYSYTPYLKGSGYVYPYAYYGYSQSTSPQPGMGGTAYTNLYDYRPAIFVKETVDRMFAQPGLTGFSYEFTGDTDLTEKFNSLILPNLQEKIASKITGFQIGFTRSPTQSGVTSPFTFFEHIPNPFDGDFEYYNYWYGWLNLQNVSFTGSNTYLNTFNKESDYSWRLLSDIVADARIEIDYEVSVSDETQFVFKIGSNYDHSEYILMATASYPATFTGNIVINLPTHQYYINELIFIEVDHWQTSYNATDTVLSFDATASYIMPTTPTDAPISALLNTPITPTLPEKVSQYDFLKSLMLMFNLYAYVEKERPKHIIFKTYDDFHVLSTAPYIVNYAIDWSNKVVYSADLKKNFNLTIPKRYTYTYKDDKDWINEKYKKKYNTVYSELKFTDEYGITDEKKIDVIFSPSPQVKTLGKTYPMLRGGDDDIQKPTNLNTRILYYNGVRSCPVYSIINPKMQHDYINNRDYNVVLSSPSQYGEASEYYNPNNTTYPLSSLQWARPREVYFTADDNYYFLPTLYTDYYRNQVSELTNSNLFVIDCKVLLSEFDMANFDFKVPVFISTPQGNSYFKVIQVSWKDSKTPASVKLQSINFGAEQ